MSAMFPPIHWWQIRGAWQWRRTQRRCRALSAQVRACPHANQRPNPDATLRTDIYTYTVCLDCGTGIGRRKP